jgi:Lon protease-like protein
MEHTTPDFTGFTPGMIQIPRLIPIFPLPRTVLMPGEVLPLHIFEPRYRDMVRDALASHMVFGLVEALPDSDTVDPGAGRIRNVGSVGFMAHHQELPDGRYMLWVLGLERFHIDEELTVATPYRQVRVSFLPVEESADRLAGIQPLRQELKILLPQLVKADGTTRDLLAGQMREISDTQLIALACQILEMPSHRKQQVLEADSVVDRFLLVYEDVYRNLDANPDFDLLDGAELN